MIIAWFKCCCCFVVRPHVKNWTSCATSRLSPWHHWWHHSTSSSSKSWERARTARWCWRCIRGEVSWFVLTCLVHVEHFDKQDRVYIWWKRSTSYFNNLWTSRNPNGSEVLPPPLHHSPSFPAGIQSLRLLLHTPFSNAGSRHLLLHSFSLCLCPGGWSLWRPVWCHRVRGQ